MSKLINYCKSIFVQPLTFKNRRKLKESVFFLSFSDAVIFLSQHFQVDKNKDFVLLPDYYCPDTIAVFARYFRLAFYKIEDNFQVNWESYFSQLEKVKPRCLVNYSFSGFYLSADDNQRLRELVGQDTIIIEDRAHHPITEQPSEFINKNHFYIDSIRKHSSFLGSRLFGADRQAKIKINRWGRHKFACQILKAASNFFNLLAVILPWPKLELANWSEAIFEILDEKVGKNPVAYGGSQLSLFYYNFIDLQKLKHHRLRIALAYQSQFTQIRQPGLGTFDFAGQPDWDLNYFPLRVDGASQDGLIRYLHKLGIFAEKFWLLPEELKHLDLNRNLYGSFIIFPITWLVSEGDVGLVAKKIKDYFEQK